MLYNYVKMHGAKNIKLANIALRSQEIPAFYIARRFVTSFTRARHLSLSWARSIQSM